MKAIQSFSLGRWIMHTSIGFALGIVILILFAGILESFKIDVLFPLAAGLGLGIGGMQWLLLKNYFEEAAKWIWLLIVGLTIPFLFYDLTTSYLKLEEWFFLVLWVFGGLLSGYLQYRFYLNSRVEKAKLWVGYSFAGWLFCALLVSIVFVPMIQSWGRNTQMVLNSIAIFGCGPLLGVTTGIGILSIIGKTK